MVGKGKEVIPPSVDESDTTSERVDGHAFDLITSFKKELRNAEDFQDAAVDHYFGVDAGDDSGSFLDAPRIIVFWRGNVKWEVDYTFTDYVQELQMSREDHSIEAAIIADSVLLKSRRFFGQRPILQPEVSKSHLLHDAVGKATPSTPGVNKNNSAAILEVGEVLDNFRSTA